MPKGNTVVSVADAPRAAFCSMEAAQSGTPSRVFALKGVCCVLMCGAIVVDAEMQHPLFLLQHRGAAFWSVEATQSDDSCSSTRQPFRDAPDPSLASSSSP